MKKSGTADLPLHGGHVPEWLYGRMSVLGRMSRIIEQRHDPFADVNKVIKHEWVHSHEYGGMTVFGRSEPPVQPSVRQMSLFDDA